MVQHGKYLIGWGEPVTTPYRNKTYRTSKRAEPASGDVLLVNPD
jgi:hypothetical protein